MTYLDRLTALAQRTSLLQPEQGDEQRAANAVAFTHLAAWELREEGFAAVKSTDPKAAHDIKPGFLVGRETREHLRIIANLDTPQQVVVWDELPRAGKDVEHVKPVDPTQSPAIQGALNGMTRTAPKPSKKDDSKSEEKPRKSAGTAKS